MKNKNGMTLLKKLVIGGAAVGGFITIFVATAWLVDFFRIGDTVAENEQRIYKVEEYIAEQQTYTKALNDILIQQQQPQYSNPYNYQNQQTNYPNQPYQQPTYQQPQYEPLPPRQKCDGYFANDGYWYCYDGGSM